MTALKANEVAAFIRKPEKKHRIVLVYGPDQGLVSEHAQALVKGFLGTNDDPFALVKLDSEQLNSDPGRLLDELSTIALFGGERVVWVKADGRTSIAAFELALSVVRPAALVVEAGDLKGNAPLRRLFEQSPNAVAAPCFSDSVTELSRLIDEEFTNSGQILSPEARTTLLAQLGGDRLASRQEIHKLSLYCLGQPRIEEDDVLIICGDVSTLALDGLVDAVGMGERQKFLAYYQRLIAEGQNPNLLASATLRHITQLYTVRLDIDRGRTTSDAMRALIPPIFFKRIGLFERQLILWDSERALIAHNILADALLDIRRRPLLAATLCERAMLRVALMVRPRQNV